MDSDDLDGEDTVRSAGFPVGKGTKDLSGSLSRSEYC
jgi:hypothetical protein